MVDTKVCRECGASAPRNLFPARGARCKACVAAYARAYYEANRDAIRARQNEYAKRYYAENRDRVNEKHRQYREANRDDILAKKRAHYLKNRSRLLAQAQAYQAANAERYRDYLRAWREANPDKASAQARRRRSRKIGARGSHTERDWRRTLRIWNSSCAYCGQSGDLTRDHVVPLSRGGSDFIGNIVPACARCNSSKNAKTIMEWVVSR